MRDDVQGVVKAKSSVLPQAVRDDAQGIVKAKNSVLPQAVRDDVLFYSSQKENKRLRQEIFLPEPLKFKLVVNVISYNTFISVNVDFLNIFHQRICRVCTCTLIVECQFNHFIKFIVEVFFFYAKFFD